MDDDNPYRVIPRLFHIINVRLEAAARIADRAEGSRSQHRCAARQLHAIADEIHILADAIIALDRTCNVADA